MRKLITSLFFMSVVVSTFAASAYTVKKPALTWWKPSPFYVGAYGGYGDIQGAYHSDGQTAMGRLAFGLHIVSYKRFSLGTEVAVQSGNTMRLNVSAAELDSVGTTIPQATLKPFVDLLATLKIRFMESQPFVGIIKGGIAYRQLQLNDRTSSRDAIRQTNAELQLGLGYEVTEHVLVDLLYQGIYSGASAGVTFDSAADTYIKRIPTQQAGLLGVEYTF